MRLHLGEWPTTHRNVLLSCSCAGRQLLTCHRVRAWLQVDLGSLGLAIYAVLASLIGAFYYLRLIKVMYFDSAKLDAPLDCGIAVQSLIAANGVAVLLLGILPGPLMAACLYTVRMSLAA